MKKSAIDMLFDELCLDNIKATNLKGEVCEFKQIALIPYNEMLFTVLAEVHTDNIYIYMYDVDDDEEVLVLVEDDELIEEVLAEYDRLCA